MRAVEDSRDDAGIYRRRSRGKRVAERKLNAVLAILDAYGETPSPRDGVPGGHLSKALREHKVPALKRPSTPLSERSKKDQFTPYGHAVVQAAVREVQEANNPPMRTREIVERLQAKDVEVRGNDPVNALGALLARCSALQSHGKQGWSIAKPYGLIPPNENGALNGHAASAPERTT